jgi:N-methylhydantoinase A
MLLADRRRDYAAGVLGKADPEASFEDLERRAKEDLPSGVVSRLVDVRYAGQSYELTIPWGESFHEAHRRLYGFADENRATEVVAVRIRAIEKVNRPNLEAREAKPPARGPAVLAHYGSTTYVPEGWDYRTDNTGNLIITH